MTTQKPYKHFLVDNPLPYVAHVQINRPAKLNAFFTEMWLELKVVFDNLSVDPEVRTVVLSGAGERAFTAGLDVQFASQQGVLKEASGRSSDAARKAVIIKRDVEVFQSCVSSVEKCEKRMSFFKPGVDVFLEHLKKTALIYSC
jgi:Delta3,5-Delta2,4-dienoyl-CoA isomerase